jgi:G6PDH family F420-dependent oxidoreductase
VVRLGYFLSSEEWDGKALVEQARLAEQAGFEALWISDHYHPWNDEQGHSPFVWSVIGAISQATSLPITTAVTCPTVRMHPAVIAQAAATSAVLLDGRFVLGVGSGEQLNEHIVAERWHPTDLRLERLAEAINVMRKLWTGDNITFRGKHYTVEDARIYTLPAEPPPIYMSGFGPKSIGLAGRIADGFISTKPDAEAVRLFRNSGGLDRTCQGGYKVCWSTDRNNAIDTAFRLWPNEYLPGELAQELRTPRHFEQASSLVTREMVAENGVCGNDVDQHIERLMSYVDADFDEVYVNQIGPEQEGFFEFYATEILPRVQDRLKTADRRSGSVHQS